MVVVAGGDLIMAMMVVPIVQNFQNPDPVRSQWLPLAIFGVFLLRGIGSYVSEYGMAYTGHRVVFDLRRALVDQLLRLPTPYYDVTPSGMVQSKLTFDAHQLASAASGTITTAIRSSLTIATMLGWLLWINWRLTMMTFVDPAGRRGRHPLLQPAAAAHRARRADAHRLDDARARGDDRRPPRSCASSAAQDYERARAVEGRQRAAQLDDQAVVGERGELAADAVPRRAARSASIVYIALAQSQTRRARPRDVHARTSSRCSRCSSG